MGEIDKVCTVLVTFNRKELLVESLEAIRKQTRPVQAIYLIDNASTDGTPEYLLEKGYIKELPPTEIKEPWEKEFEIKNLTDGSPIKFYYVRMPKNTGSAGGFREGLKRAYEKGYEWFWLTDDDGYPAEDCLENLMKYKEKYHFLSPLVINRDKPEELSFGIKDIETNRILTKVEEVKKEIYFDTANPFNGTLVSRYLVSKIGFPMQEFFIWGEEVEFMRRAMKHGFKVVTIPKAKFYAPGKKFEERRVFNFFILWADSPLRSYCLIRNTAYIYRKYRRKELIRYFYRAFLAFLTGKLTFQEYRFYLSAFFDGLLGIWGKEKRFLDK
jgi:GT2 family glycosyltransferase